MKRKLDPYRVGLATKRAQNKEHQSKFLSSSQRFWRGFVEALSKIPKDEPKCEWLERSTK